MTDDLDARAPTAGVGTDPATEVVARVGDSVSTGIDGLRRAVVDAPVFAVHDVDGRTVITASTLSYSSGFGFGGGGGPSGEVRTVGPATGGGGGGGGAGTGEGRPVAVIDVSGGDVRIHPVVDWTKVGAAIIAAIVTMWVAARRGRRG